MNNEQAKREIPVKAIFLFNLKKKYLKIMPIGFSTDMILFLFESGNVFLIFVRLLNLPNATGG